MENGSVATTDMHSSCVTTYIVTGSRTVGAYIAMYIAVNLRTIGVYHMASEDLKLRS